MIDQPHNFFIHPPINQKIIILHTRSATPIANNYIMLFSSIDNDNFDDEPFDCFDFDDDIIDGSFRSLLGTTTEIDAVDSSNSSSFINLWPSVIKQEDDEPTPDTTKSTISKKRKGREEDYNTCHRRVSVSDYLSDSSSCSDLELLVEDCTPPPTKFPRHIGAVTPPSRRSIVTPTNASTPSKEKYQKTLQNLAESMKRTELSRRQVAMMQNNNTTQSFDIIKAEQVRSLVASSIEQQLNEHSSGSGVTPSRNSSPVTVMSPISGLSADVNVKNVIDFLSGSRPTLTDGLAKSRMQLKAYQNNMSARLGGFPSFVA